MDSMERSRDIARSAFITLGFALLFLFFDFAYSSILLLKRKEKNENSSLDCQEFERFESAIKKELC